MREIRSVEWLAEKYNYITWMRNRDEISPGLADELRKKYLEQAEEIHKQEIIKAHINGGDPNWDNIQESAENYYNKTFKSK